MRRLISGCVVAAVAAAAAPLGLVAEPRLMSGHAEQANEQDTISEAELRHMAKGLGAVFGGTRLPSDIETPRDAGDDADETFQDQQLETILDEITPVNVISLNRRRDHEAASTARGLWAPLRSPFAVVFAALQQNVPPLQMLVTSLGVSTGEAFSVQFVNQGPGPIRLPRTSLTLRPLKKPAAERAIREFGQLSGRRTTIKLYGYCLDYEKVAPIAGMVYTVASGETQSDNQPVRDVLRSATVLHARGFIRPDDEPRVYLHSIRQWALWTREQKFTEASFANAMLDHAKKNTAKQNGNWTNEDEKHVRATAARRWRDVRNVLRLADKAAELRGRR